MHLIYIYMLETVDYSIRIGKIGVQPLLIVNSNFRAFSLGRFSFVFSLTKDQRSKRLSLISVTTVYSKLILYFDLYLYSAYAAH